MAQIQRSLATLRIMGDNLDPTEITRLLGCAPDAAQTRGEEIAARSGGSVRVARKGMWRLSATDRQIRVSLTPKKKRKHKVVSEIGEVFCLTN